MPELGLFQNIWANLAIIAFLVYTIVWIVHISGQIKWRLIDLCTLLFGAVGFLVPAFEVQQMGFEIESSIQRGWSGGELSGLEITTSRMLENCSPAVRTEISPLDFALLAEERSRVCAWSESLSEFVDTLSRDSIRQIPQDLLASFPDVREVPVGPTKQRLFEIMDEWNEHVIERQDAEAHAQLGTPQWLVVLSPYLLAIAFSLALAGVMLKPRD